MLFATALALLPLLCSASSAAKVPLGSKIPLSKRAEWLKDQGSFAAMRNNSMTKIKNGLQNYKKNTGTDHPLSRHNSPSKRATGQGAEPLAFDSNNSMWQGTISVGTPPVEYSVLFDTGSSDLFLFGSQCGSGCEGHTEYDPSKSTSSKALGKQVELEYSAGSGEATLYTDTVEIAGLTASPQTLGALTKIDSGFPSSFTPVGGLMGLAYPSMSQYNANPVFQTLISEGQVNQSVFGLTLADKGPELYLGGVNQDLYTGEFTYVPVTPGFWQINIDSIEVNGQKTISGPIPTIIDSGSEFIYGDFPNVLQFYESVEGSQLYGCGDGCWTVPCNSSSNISFVFGGKPFAFENLAKPIEGSANQCMGTIVASDPLDGSNAWTIGDGFLKGVYTAFDFGNNRVGFATLAA